MDGEHKEALHKGRGAIRNIPGRFDREAREAVDDGWWHEDESPSTATEVRGELCRTALSRNTSPDVGFDRSLNPYRGCEHGCVIATPDQPTPTSACLPASISRPGSAPRPISPKCSPPN
jgi:hypothetical protein